MIKQDFKELFANAFNDSLLKDAHIEPMLENIDVETLRLEVLQIKACCNLFLKQLDTI